VARVFRSIICLVVGAASLLVGMKSIDAGDWSRFRGPNGSAVSDATNLPATWDDQTNLRWKTSLPGPGSSSPIVVGDRIFVTCYSGYGIERENPGDVKNLKRHLVCLNLNDGTVAWDRATPARQPEDSFRGFICDHGYATSTPASDGKRVFVFYGKTGVLAYDLDGKELWKTEVGDGSGKNRWGSGSSPVLYGDLVIVNAAAESKAVIALRKDTGREAWRADAANVYGSWSTPVLVDAPNGKKELVLSAPYEVWGFNPDSGEFLWYADGIADDTICGSVVAKDGIVYAAGGRSGSAVAIRSGGRDDASKTHIVWKKQLSSYVPSPVLAGDHIFCVNERGILSGLTVKDGGATDQKRLPSAGSIYASPIVADNKLYIVTRRSGTFVVSAKGDGEVLAQNKFDDDTDFNASPAIVDGTLLLRSNRFLYCVGANPAK
jgi:outer membrane protein assembly factor BamB